MIIPVLILIWLGGNALAALIAMLFGWLDRRATERALESDPVWIYPPGLEEDCTDRVIAEAFFAVPEFMAMVRNEEDGETY